MYMVREAMEPQKMMNGKESHVLAAEILAHVSRNRKGSSDMSGAQQCLVYS